MSVAASDSKTISKTSYILDKLQSLSGVIPIGAFLAEHFWSNSYALVSVQSYNKVSSDLQIIPWRIFVESLVLWLPILFHGLYGIYIWWRGKSNALGHPWMANWLCVLQRWTGIIAFIFIGWHVYTRAIRRPRHDGLCRPATCHAESLVFRFLSRRRHLPPPSTSATASGISPANGASQSA